MVRKLNCFLLVLSLVLSVPLTSSAQVQDLPYNNGAAAAWQALLKLRTTATVLFTQAHPDDEDAGLVTWVARHTGARTGILSLTRGEGGANLIGPEQYDALGVLRTEEFLAACRYYGADLMFTRMADFGFSKRLDETLEHWDKETVLRDMVRTVRAYRPDIIISRFHGKARDGHGNHQAAGLLSLEVFKAAADPKMFPDEGAPWQVKKLYLSTRGNEPSTLKINTGAYDPLLGKSYRQIGSEGYGMHRSQAMGQPRIPAGDFFSTLQLAESAIPKVENETSIFDGIDTTLTGLGKQYQNEVDLRPELNEAANAIELASSKFNAREPWTIAEELASGMRNIRKVIEKIKASNSEAKKYLEFLLNIKERAFTDAMNNVLGITLESIVGPDRPSGRNVMVMQNETFAVAIPEQVFSITTTLTNHSGLPIKVLGGGYVTYFNAKTTTLESGPEGLIKGGMLETNRPRSQKTKFELQEKGRFDRPFWSRNSEIKDHAYSIRNGGIITAFDLPQFEAFSTYRLNDVFFQVRAFVQTSFIARPFGEQRRLLTVAPAINIQMTPRVGIVALNAAKSEATVNVSVSSNAKSKAEGKVKLRVPEGWIATPAEQSFSFAREGEKGNFTFHVAIPKLATGKEFKIQAVAEYNGKEYTEGYEVIAHPDLEPRHLYRNATMDIRGIDVQVAPNLHVGYVMGVGDKVPEALEQIGVNVTMLGATELAAGNLDQFDAVVIGIRASAVREDLKAYNKRLLDYVERGGNLIWQYQTPEFDEVAYGPYPYKMGRNPEEVSEEDSNVAILAPTHPVFNWPNKITEADFKGWVEERGSKWWDSWDAHYQPLLETHDRGQAPQRGGLLFAPYGKGTFVYAGYAFYRQLPAGVQGGYRLFANLISLKKRPKN